MLGGSCSLLLCGCGWPVDLVPVMFCTASVVLLLEGSMGDKLNTIFVEYKFVFFIDVLSAKKKRNGM